jgi:hypothetical protein
MMRRQSLIAARHGAAARLPAGEILGPQHALVRAIDASQSAARQWLDVAAVLAGSIIALSEGRNWAAAAAISAGIVLLGLTGLVAALERRKRDRAVDLIVDGRESLPLAAVQRQPVWALRERGARSPGRWRP